MRLKKLRPAVVVLLATLCMAGAPWAPRANANNRMLVSKRVGCFSHSAIYTVDLAAPCLK